VAIPRAIYDRLNFIAEAKKSFDSEPVWELAPHRFAQRLTMVVALRLNNILRGGVSLRMRTPVDAWEEDVYGHIEVKLPGATRLLRLLPIEWRPAHYHDNPPNSPDVHRNQRLWDRWHPFDLNAEYGFQSFDQSGAGIAVPFQANSFTEYTDFCATVWRCSDLYDLPAPPWTRTLI